MNEILWKGCDCIEQTNSSKSNPSSEDLEIDLSN